MGYSGRNNKLFRIFLKKHGGSCVWCARPDTDVKFCSSVFHIDYEFLLARRAPGYVCEEDRGENHQGQFQLG